ncbi:MAG: hypothetical protein GZ094_13710 [Mariniphaga sp.]|nr:hypothetical protein [Mariniphaga sp.]
MKKFISIFCVLVLILSCTEQDYYELPKDANGNVLLTGISSTTSTGISTLDGSLTVTATLPNAKSGDVMNIELLQLQIPTTGGTTTQLLPMTGTQKTATVGADFKATVTYTRAEAKLTKASDYVTVVFNGVTEYAKARVDMVPAITSTKPIVSGVVVDVARTAETAYFNVNVMPKEAAYTGTLVAKRKNGTTGTWVTITGSPFSGTQPFMVPISGTDFAAGKDTMFYSFSAAKGTYMDEVMSTVIVRDPYFFLKKSATLTLGGSSAGRNLLINAAVAENDATANIAVSGSLVLKGGSAWLAAGKTIEFVPTTAAMYDANNLTNTIAAFTAGTKTTTADPISGTGTFIFKIVNGTAVADVYYGLLKVTSVLPGVSTSFEYRIGDKYAHLSVVK